jgi:hypothetical protein
MAFVTPISQPPVPEYEGVYNGFTYRVKGDGRVETKDPANNVFMHRSVINAMHWIDNVGSVVGPTCTLDSIDPTSVDVGAPTFTLTLTGTGFTEDAALVWNGVQDTLTFVSDTELTTEINMDLVTVPSTATVAVYQGGYTTPSLPFEFKEAAP